MTIEDYFSNIAAAIREKGGTSALITPGDMPQAILDLPSGGEIAYRGIIDVPDNASTTHDNFLFDYDIPTTQSSEEYTISYIYMFADNQSTAVSIGNNTTPASEMRAWSAAGDNIFLLAGSTNVTGGLSITTGYGDRGNHADTLVGFRGAELKAHQEFYLSQTAQLTIAQQLRNAYIIVLYSVYGGGTSNTLTLNDDSISVPRYANRYSNSIYIFSRKYDVLTAGSLSITIDGTAANIIGIAGVFA